MWHSLAAFTELNEASAAMNATATVNVNATTALYKRKLADLLDNRNDPSSDFGMSARPASPAYRPDSPSYDSDADTRYAGAYVSPLNSWQQHALFHFQATGGMSLLYPTQITDTPANTANDCSDNDSQLSEIRSLSDHE